MFKYDWWCTYNYYLQTPTLSRDVKLGSATVSPSGHWNGKILLIKLCLDKNVKVFLVHETCHMCSGG